jgi:hypothetical protein
MSAPSVSLIERRAHTRIMLELRCYTVSATKPRVLVGRTVNISRTGLLMLWDATPPAAKTPKLGELLKVDIELPASSVARKCIRCRGRVVRVQMAEKRIPLIAVAIAQMDFRDHEVEPSALKSIEGGRARKAFGEVGL